MKVGLDDKGRGGERGLVTVIVLALIILVAIYVRLNSGAIRAMKEEVELISRTSEVSSSVDVEVGHE